MSDEGSSQPVSLRVLAILFIVDGAWALISIAVGMAQGRGLRIEGIGLLSLLAGIGLLQLSRGWRVYALVCAWAAMLVAPVAAVLTIVAGPQPTFSMGFFDWTFRLPWLLSFPFYAGIFAYGFWEYRTLTSPRVRHLFGIRAEQARQPDAPEASAIR